MTPLSIFPNTNLNFCSTTHQTSYFNRLIDLINKSQESILVCQYVFSISHTRQWQRSNKVLNAFLKSYYRGVDIKFLFDRPRLHSPNFKTNANTAFFLISKGLPVRCLSVTKTLHIKLLIFDRKIFLAGSHNLTNSSLYSPFELSFECADDFLTNSAVIYFNTLWDGPLSQPYPNDEKALELFFKLR